MCAGGGEGATGLRGGVALSDVYAHSGCVAAQLDVCLVSCELVCVCVCVCVICETFPRHARQFASHVCLCVCACVGQTLLSYGVAVRGVCECVESL